MRESRLRGANWKCAAPWPGHDRPCLTATPACCSAGHVVTIPCDRDTLRAVLRGLFDAQLCSLKAAFEAEPEAQRTLAEEGMFDALLKSGNRQLSHAFWDHHTFVLLEPYIFAESVEPADGQRFWCRPCVGDATAADADAFLRRYAGSHAPTLQTLKERDRALLAINVVFAGDLPLLAYLIEQGVCAADAVLPVVANTPLIGASRFGNDDIVRYLCERVALEHIDHQTPSNGLSALIDAAKCGHEHTVRLLLAYGADTELRRSNGQTAMMQAASRGFAGCVRVLIDAGTELSARDSDGKTAADLAAENGHTDVAALLCALEVHEATQRQTPRLKQRTCARSCDIPCATQ